MSIHDERITIGIAQALDQVQAYLVLHRFLKRQGLPLDGKPEPETLTAAAGAYLQERTMLLSCLQAILLYAEGEAPLCLLHTGTCAATEECAPFAAKPSCA